MEMHAYSEDYLLTAQRILGDMLDYAVNEYEFDPDEFYKMFLVSDVSRQFQEGNPTYIAGKNGCEIVKEVIRSAGLVMEEIPDEMYLDKSPEYWAKQILMSAEHVRKTAINQKLAKYDLSYSVRHLVNVYYEELARIKIGADN